jgi:hypothetical protein
MSAGSTDAARAELEGRILEWMHEPEWKEDEPRFERLALDLFALQFSRCLPYQRFCAGRSRTPDSVHRWWEIPAVPTGAFKEVALRCFPEEATIRTFRTSGTSLEGRGELHLDSLDLYEASLLSAFERGVLPDLAKGERMRMRVLAPSPEEAPDSSLSTMFGCVLHARGDACSGFDVLGGQLDVGGITEHLRECERSGIPMALCGTAFGFVHLLDALAAAHPLHLPAGSRVMETGGFKGRSRELSRRELYEAIEARLGIPPVRIVNQYGMTELGSQFYDSVLCQPGEPRCKLRPPWTRVRLLDPESGTEVDPDRPGRIAVFDLANAGSVLAVQTADLARGAGDGFEVLGREPGAEARGCSLAADVMLGGDAA